MSDYCSCCGEVKSTPICADCLNETIDLMTAKGDKLTAARERIRTLETELEKMTAGYIHETASGHGYSPEFVEVSAPLVKEARAALAK